ncbi:MAG: hypothetical protein RLN62_01060 [Rickettsiales bacterium]
MYRLSSNIEAGRGFSADSQQMAPEVCYKANVVSVSGETSSLRLGVAQSFTDLQNDVKESVTVKGGIGMFSASAEASYMRSVEEKDFSLSLNYYAYYSSTASVQLSGYGEGALTSHGKGFYQNGNNPYFGLVCGDHFLASYEQGALLLMGINLEFSSKFEKDIFNANAKVSYGNIFEASGDVQQVVTKYGISGSVAIQAFQKGGETSKLSDILDKDSSGDYYALTCALSKIDDCVKTADKMLDYAKDNFPTQFSFKDDSGLVPLGVGFTDPKTIKYAGLIPPQPLITPQVTADINTLAESLSENKYYQQKFEELLNGYLVPWDTSSKIYHTSSTLYKHAQNNIDLIMSTSNPAGGAKECFSSPEDCNAITSNIISNLKSITSSDLSFLNGLEGIQYSFKIQDIGAYIYKSGDIKWNGYPSPMHDSRLLVTLHTFNVDNESLNFTADAHVPEGIAHFTYYGISIDGGNSYTGTLKDPLPSEQTYYRETSPFYFVPYDNFVSGEIQEA